VNVVLANGKLESNNTMVLTVIAAVSFNSHISPGLF
jgi:hypothetical protein